MPAIAILGATRKLLRLPRAVRTLDMTIMPTRVSEVDHYIAKAAPFARPVLQYLRDVMHEGAPGVVEAMKVAPFLCLSGGNPRQRSCVQRALQYGALGKRDCRCDTSVQRCAR
jgi:hypothetical protein